MKNWKTTLCGLLALLFGGLAAIAEMPPLWAKVFGLLPGFLSGVGLMFARDANVSSAQMGLNEAKPAWKENQSL